MRACPAHNIPAVPSSSCRDQPDPSRLVGAIPKPAQRPCHEQRQLPKRVFDGPILIAWRTLGVHRLSAACFLSLVLSTATFCESRRSTRVPLKVVITVEGGAQRLRCEGETIVVNLHGALIATTIGLSSGMRITIRVYLTD